VGLVVKRVDYRDKLPSRPPDHLRELQDDVTPRRKRPEGAPHGA